MLGIEIHVFCVLLRFKLDNRRSLIKAQDKEFLEQVCLLPTSQAFWKTRRPDEAADYRAVRRYVYPKKISETLKSSVESVQHVDSS